MPDWINFSTVGRWATDNAGASDCSRMCASCQKEWHTLKLEGKEDMAVHMIQLSPTEKTPCGMAFKFLCDDCYLLDAIL